jgi:voltage-dependent calcium channel L type alpha-1D
MINTITLAMKFYKQPEFYTDALDVLNMVFTAVFAMEFVFKLAAFRFKVCNFSVMLCHILQVINIMYIYKQHNKQNMYNLFQNYFGDAWNVFDFIIVLGSFIDIVYSEVNVSILFLSSSFFNANNNHVQHFPI